MSLVERLEWESETYGIEVWRVDAGLLLRDRLQAAKDYGAQLVIARGVVERMDVLGLVNEGFRMADDMVTLRRPLDSLPRVFDVSAPIAIEDVPWGLVEFPHSRFAKIGPFAGVRPERVAYERYLRGMRRGTVVDGQVVGFAAWSSGQDEAEHRGTFGSLDLLWVDERARGRGYGKALVADVLAQMASCGCLEAEVTTWLAEEAALSVYRKAGFKAVRRLQTWWREL